MDSNPTDETASVGTSLPVQRSSASISNGVIEPWDISSDAAAELLRSIPMDSAQVTGHNQQAHESLTAYPGVDRSSSALFVSNHEDVGNSSGVRQPGRSGSASIEHTPVPRSSRSATTMVSFTASSGDRSSTTNRNMGSRRPIHPMRSGTVPGSATRPARSQAYDREQNLRGTSAQRTSESSENTSTTSSHRHTRHSVDLLVDIEVGFGSTGAPGHQGFVRRPNPPQHYTGNERGQNPGQTSGQINVRYRRRPDFHRHINPSWPGNISSPVSSSRVSQRPHNVGVEAMSSTTRNAAQRPVDAAFGAPNVTTGSSNATPDPSRSTPVFIDLTADSPPPEFGQPPQVIDLTTASDEHIPFAMYQQVDSESPIIRRTSFDRAQDRQRGIIVTDSSSEEGSSVEFAELQGEESSSVIEDEWDIYHDDPYGPEYGGDPWAGVITEDEIESRSDSDSDNSVQITGHAPRNAPLHPPTDNFTHINPERLLRRAIFDVFQITEGSASVVHYIMANNHNTTSTTIAPGRVSPSILREVPPPGFAFDTGEKGFAEDEIAVCASCDRELAYDPESEEDTSTAVKPKKTTKRAKKQDDKHFWALKQCGHVYCEKCYQNRFKSSSLWKQTLWRLPDGECADGTRWKEPESDKAAEKTANSRVVYCAVPNCETNAKPVGAWIGIFM